MTAAGAGVAKKATDTVKGIKAAKEAERVKSLGFDLQIGGKLRPAELRCAPIVEKQRSVRLTRAGKNDRYDWIDQHGKTYDHIGGRPGGGTDMEQFLTQLEKHKNKCDTVVIDLKEFSPDEIKAIMDQIKDWPNPPVIVP